MTTIQQFPASIWEPVAEVNWRRPFAFAQHLPISPDALGIYWPPTTRYRSDEVDADASHGFPPSVRLAMKARMVPARSSGLLSIYSHARGPNGWFGSARHAGTVAFDRRKSAATSSFVSRALSGSASKSNFGGGGMPKVPFRDLRFSFLVIISLRAAGRGAAIVGIGHADPPQKNIDVDLLIWSVVVGQKP